MDNVKLGRIGENMASDFLRTKGFTILARNFREKRYEVDIIGRKGNTYIFVEVKTRTTIEFGEPIEAVDKKKLKNIFKAAEGYKAKHSLWDITTRVDVVEVLISHREDLEL